MTARDKVLAIRMTSDLFDRLYAAGHINERSVSAQIRFVMVEWLDWWESEPENREIVRLWRERKEEQKK